jgi:hypothetical protein
MFIQRFAPHAVERQLRELVSVAIGHNLARIGCRSRSERHYRDQSDNALHET